MSMQIDRSRAVLLVVDVQERLSAVMKAEEQQALEKNTATLIELARRLGFPIVLSEQYKKGLGNTVPTLENALATVAHERFEKVEFGCTDAPAFAPIFEQLRGQGRSQWLVAGMETHICVYQTVRGLCSAGADVQVVRDAVISRSAENRALGFELCRQAGALLTSTETAVFDALGKAGSDDFKALSKLIK
jgi:nicotinamidase-related amidase